MKKQYICNPGDRVSFSHMLRCCRYAELRKRYVPLLISAISRINSELRHRSLARRAKAVKNAAHNCLIQAAAAASEPTRSSDRQNYITNRPILAHLHPLLRTSRDPNPISLPKFRHSDSMIKTNPQFRSAYLRILRSRSAADRLRRRRSVTIARRHRTKSVPIIAESGNMIPAQDDLLQLQNVILSAHQCIEFDHNLAANSSLITADRRQRLNHVRSINTLPAMDSRSALTARASRSEDDGLNYGDDNSTDTHPGGTAEQINPAALLSRAARYILTLQFQVDGLQAALDANRS